MISDNSKPITISYNFFQNFQNLKYLKLNRDYIKDIQWIKQAINL